MELVLISRWQQTQEVELFYHNRQIYFKKQSYFFSKLADSSDSSPYKSLGRNSPRWLSASFYDNFIAYQTIPYEIELVNLENMKRAQIRMGKKRLILGYQWTESSSSQCDFVMITSTGIECYKIGANFKFVNVKGVKYIVKYYWIHSEFILISHSSEVLTFSTRTLTHGPVFDIDLSYISYEDWTEAKIYCQNMTDLEEKPFPLHVISLEELYGEMYLIHLGTRKGKLSFYRIENQAEQVVMNVPKGPGKLRVIDNLLLVYLFKVQETLVIDILRGFTTFMIIRHGIPQDPVTMTVKIKVYKHNDALKISPIFLYDKQDIPFMSFYPVHTYETPLYLDDYICPDNDITIDVKHGRCYKIVLNCDKLIDNYPRDTEAILFLMRRNGYIEIAVSKLYYSLQKHADLIDLYKIFLELNSIHAWDHSVLLESVLKPLFLERLVSDSYLISVFLEFYRAADEQKPDQALDLLFVKLLVRNGCLELLNKLIQYLVIQPTDEIGLYLVNFENSFLIGIDVFHLLNNYAFIEDILRKNNYLYEDVCTNILIN